MEHAIRAPVAGVVAELPAGTGQQVEVGSVLAVVKPEEPADDLERFVRALSDPYPRAFAFYQGERIEVLEAHVSDACYGGTQGRVMVQEEGGVVVCGSHAYRGGNRGLVITRVRSADGVECSGDKFFRRGGYLDSHPYFAQQSD